MELISKEEVRATIRTFTIKLDDGRTVIYKEYPTDDDAPVETRLTDLSDLPLDDEDPKVSEEVDLFIESLRYKNF